MPRTSSSTPPEKSELFVETSDRLTDLGTVRCMSYYITDEERKRILQGLGKRERLHLHGKCEVCWVADADYLTDWGSEVPQLCGECDWFMGPRRD